ncbi:hypothetical protein DUI87_04690 [Hirundo rustica rustica]|uniref:Transmembrane protein 163 n=1 Tax=Hirundo rustica rustica TaxID=333673 RepID=A0A3M0L4I3_HIRRU|nr:hypothetical protein DUI87_04690 [Hirundo rustica rustica]
MGALFLAKTWLDIQSQGVVVTGVPSSWGCHQWRFPGLSLFNVFTDDPDKDIEGTLSKFTASIKLGRNVEFVNCLRNEIQCVILWICYIPYLEHQIIYGAVARVQLHDVKACVILGVIFLLSSICIVIKAIHDLAKRVLPEVLDMLRIVVNLGMACKDDFLYSVSVLSGILCTVLAVIKFMLGKVLTSRALITDGFNSLVGGIMGFSILLSAEVFKHNSSVWYLDGSIGVLIGLTISAYGIKLLIDMVPRVRQTRHYEMFE